MKAGSAAKLIVDALLQRFLPLARRRIETAQVQVFLFYNITFDFDYTQSMLWSPLFPHAYNPTDMDFGPIAFDNESGSGFGLEMEKSNCGAKNLRPNNIRKKIATVVFNISLNLLRNKNKNKEEHSF
ncbi:furry-like protein [Gossypium australe]|uniref:Furry-like protein n=1 Tax=Gossypium australe TaxID=47621 RepID=A0A5B6VAK1_9ROSI|nr:furry-like protein [Gossypium australe]